jgi:hypothetical protein
MFKRFFLAGTILAACGVSSAYAGCTSGLPGHAGGPPTGTTFGSGLDDLNWATDCQGTENAIDLEPKATRDDAQLFSNKIVKNPGTTTTSYSFDTNSSLSTHQNVLLDSVTRGSGFDSSTEAITVLSSSQLSADAGAPFTEGNGFANIKSIGDQDQEVIIDPEPGASVWGKAGTPFVGFDGLYLRGQLADFVAPGAAPAAAPAAGPDTGSVTFAVDLFNPTTLTHLTDIYTYSGIAVGSDFGAIGFDENGALPAGYFVDQLVVETDAAHAFDQIKQIAISVPGASIPTVPEARTWVMLVAGFGLMGSVGYWRRRSVAVAG